MDADAITAAAPVAQQALGVFGALPASVQVAIIVCVALILLACLLGWGWRVKHDTGTVPSSALVDFFEEVGRSVAHLAEVVESNGRTAEHLARVVDNLNASIKGCATCRWNPTRKDAP